MDDVTSDIGVDEGSTLLDEEDLLIFDGAKQQQYSTYL